MVSFGISISGLIIGIPEIKKQKKTKTIIGLIGHVIIILFFFSMAFYSMSL
jgi:cAMP phosphodiesterase